MLSDDKNEDRPMQMSPQKTQKQGSLGEVSKTSLSTNPLPAMKDPNKVEERKEGFFGMITGFLANLTVRKQAYMGRPASAMYYDEKRKRYVIPGEEESDDDEPPPPPPGGARPKIEETADTKVEKKEEEGKLQGANALTQVNFGGALANRGRGRGSGRGGRGRGGGMPAASRFPQTFTKDQMTAESKPASIPDEKLEERPDPKLFETALDVSNIDDNSKSQSQVIQGKKDEKDQTSSPKAESKPTHNRTSSIQSMSSNLNQSMFVPGSQKQTAQYDKDREQMWQQKYAKYQEKLGVYKQKIQRYQAELIKQREENEQTIENFTQLCQDLKFRGMDEVEDLQSQTKILQDQITKLSQEKAGLEFKGDQKDFEIEELKTENEELRAKVTKLYEQITDLSKFNQSPDEQNQGQGNNSGSHQGLEEGLNSTWDSSLAAFKKRDWSYGNLTPSQAESLQRDKQKMLDLQCENDKLLWRLTTMEVDSSNLVIQMQKYLRQDEENSEIKEKLKNAEREVEAQKDLVRKAKEEVLTKSQQDQQQDHQEKQSLRQMISKLQQEKERVQELQRERQTEGDQKLTQAQHQNNLLEQQIKKLEMDLKKQASGIQSDQQEQIAQSQMADNLDDPKTTEKGNEMSHEWWKNQVKQLQQILSTKEIQCEKLKIEKQEVEEQMEQILTSQSQKSAKAEQILQEVGKKANSEVKQNKFEQQEQIVQKLNDHILYLQNEIKKRDELLETSDLDSADGGSSIEDDEDDELELRIKKRLLENNPCDDADLGPDIEEIDDSDELNNDNPPQRTSNAHTMDDPTMISPDKPSKIETTQILTPSGSNHTKKVVGDQIRSQLQKVSQEHEDNKAKKMKRKTMNQILKEQVEESRQQLKKEMEQRMVVEKNFRAQRGVNGGLQEGLKDVLGVLEEIVQRERVTCQSSMMDRQQSSSLIETSDPKEDGDKDSKSSTKQDQDNQEDCSDTVQNIISKVFEIQRHYQSKMSDLRHNLQMQKLKLEDLESLTIDLDILNQEKAMTDQDIISLKQQLDQSQRSALEKQSKLHEIQNQHAQEIDRCQNEKIKTQKVFEEFKRDSERKIQEIMQENMRKIEDASKNYEIMKQAERVEQDRRYQQLEQNSKKVNSVLDEKLHSLKIANERLESNIDKIKKESESEQELIRYDLKKQEDECKIKEIEKQQLVRELEAMCEDRNQQASNHQAKFDQMQKEKESQRAQFESQTIKMRNEADTRCQEIMAQRDHHKQNAKDLKMQVTQKEEELTRSQEDLKTSEEEKKSFQETIEQLKEMNQKREDEIFWALVNQVNELKAQVKAHEQIQISSSKESSELEAVKEERDKLKKKLETTIKENWHKQKEDQKYLEDVLNAYSQQTEMQGGEQELQLQVEETQNLLDYQIGINDKLNDKNEQLQTELDQLKQAKSSLEKKQEMHEQDKELLHQHLQNLEKRQKSQNSQEDIAPSKAQEELEEAKKQITKMQSQIQENEERMKGFTNKIKEQIIDSQFKADNGADQLQLDELSSENHQMKKQVELKSKLLEEAQKQISALTLSEETMKEKLSEMEENEKQKQEQYEDREKQFMKGAEEMATKLKDKIKKEKETVKRLQEEIGGLKQSSEGPSLEEGGLPSLDVLKLQQDVQGLKYDKKKLQDELEALKNEQVSFIEHIENSKNFSFSGQNESFNFSSLKKAFDINLSQFDTKITNLTQERESAQDQILECLKKAGIEGVEDIQEKSFDNLLEKLQILLQNYQEDQRQISSLLKDNDEIHKEDEELKNQNYDLRYELQEINIKVQALEQECQRLRQGAQAQSSDQQDTHKEVIASYEQKIIQYEDQISQLKIQIGDTSLDSKQMVKADVPVSTRASSGKYADLSVNKDLDEPLTEQELNETRIRPSPEKPKHSARTPSSKPIAQPQPQLQPQAGFITRSIASLFLTESQITEDKSKVNNPAKDDEVSEYEYYEYDDEEDLDDAAI